MTGRMSAQMRTSLLLVTTAIVCLVSSLAHADPMQIDRRDHSRVGATVGLFTPTGDLGVEYTQVLHPNVEIGVGAGVGLVRVGPQVSVMPRLRTNLGPFSLTGGAGLDRKST